jgi:hypothetical protein
MPGKVFGSREELLAAISKIIAGIPKKTFHDMFEHWIERFEWISQNNGDYYPYDNMSKEVLGVQAPPPSPSGIIFTT